jgi:hypothetical protein
MADEITVRRDSKPPHPDGAFPAVCVDLIDMGESLDVYQGTTNILPKLVVVFQTNAEDPDTHKPLEIHIELTNSFGKKAKLRKLLEGWRGKPYSDDEARKGVPLHKLEKQNATLNVMHKTAVASGNTYAVIDSIMPAMKGIAKLEPHNYVRAEFWAKKKADYAAAVAQYRKQNGMDTLGETDADFAAVAGVSDDLPF